VAKLAPSPLAGKEILITRAAEQSDSLCRELESRGARPVLHPLIRFGPPQDFAPLDAAIRGLQRYDWLFLTSQNVVRALVDRSLALGISLPDFARDVHIAAVGPATAKVATDAGLCITYTAIKHQGAALVEELAAKVKGKRVLLPRSDRANPDLPESLRRMGAAVTEVVAYRTFNEPEPGKGSGFLLARPQAILFFSPSAVRAFLEQEQGAELLRSISEFFQRIPIVAIGPVTGAALREAGVVNILQSADATVPAVIDTLEEFFAAEEGSVSTGENER
jgi:uroporphyrinogen-III synthase